MFLTNRCYHYCRLCLCCLTTHWFRSLLKFRMNRLLLMTRYYHLFRLSR
jgi:hypothetical protein